MRKHALRFMAGVSMAVMLLLLLPFCTLPMKDREWQPQVDPTALLAACREVLGNAPKYRQNPNWHNVDPSQRFSLPDPNDPLMPSIIRSLKPATILIESNRVKLELGGGFRHFGYLAYAPGAPGPTKGATEIIDGLYYYDERP